MRDLLLFLIIFGSVPIILTRPWVGVIMWIFVSFMNPHRMVWGMMYDMPLSMIIGIATLVGWVACKEDRRLQPNAITVLMIMLLGWVAVTTIFAAEADIAFYKLKQFLKIILMTLIALTLIKSPKRFNYFIWIVVLSVGYFSFKGGIFTVMTGGKFTVWGPPHSLIGDNNALALASIMVIPLMFYLAQTVTNRWIRYGLYICAFFSLISVVGSYSRGAFLSMAAVGVVMWWQAKNKLAIGTVSMIVIVIGLAVVPQKWLSRMDTIQNYEEDGSALGRLEVWGHAIRVANDNPVVGGGFGVFGHEPTYLRLSPEMINRRNVHSIYFEMLGTQGYPGLIIFLLLGAVGLVMAGNIIKRTRGVPGLENEYKFALMIQLSLVAYGVGGTFLNLSTLDLYYTLLAMIVMQRTLLEKKLAEGLVAEAATDLKQIIASDRAEPTIPRHMPGQSFLRQPAK